MRRADQDISAPALPAMDEVHVRLVTLDLPDSALATARVLLSAEESRRADAFLRAQDRCHFTAARSWLRRVLAACLGLEPAGLVFGEGQNGKPYLAAAEGRLDFNLSHSGGHALLAVTPGFAVGADIEAVRPIEEKVAERFFSPAEVRALASLPVLERQDAFFRIWTRKEAYLKALGSGLATPLDAFTVSLAQGDARLLDVVGQPDEATSWQMADLEPAPGLAGAVASRRRGWRVLWLGHDDR